MVIRAQKNLNTTITLLEQYLDRLELRLNREKGATITDIGGAGRELSWISILLRQEQEDRHAVDVGIAQQTKSTTIPTKVADTCPSLDTVACQGAGGECQSPSVWLGTSA